MYVKEAGGRDNNLMARRGISRARHKPSRRAPRNLRAALRAGFYNNLIICVCKIPREGQSKFAVLYICVCA